MADLSTEFDAVVMLTWSDWRTEPRSNRYHYATRFAKQLPVYFVQKTAAGIGCPVVEQTEFDNIFIVHAGTDYGRRQSLEIERVLADHKILRPLLWIYNPFFSDFISRHSSAFIVYHATEDYFRDLNEVADVAVYLAIRAQLKLVLKKTDLLVAVSSAVLEQFVKYGGYLGGHLVAENGCDAKFWHRLESHHFKRSPDEARVALYQGAVNDRIDYGLLDAVVCRMSDWEFWFCGRVTDGADWRQLQRRSNVRYLGEMNPEGLAAVMRQASVGIIPFVDENYIRLSVPLKAYEYVASGLPVVSTWVDALVGREDLFGVATNASEFEREIRARAETRNNESAVSARLAVAASRSYDVTFEVVCERILAGKTAQCQERHSYNVLMLYDADSVHIGAVEEYLNSFRTHSRHNIHFMHGSASGLLGKRPGSTNFSAFDCVILHYSIRLYLADHLAPDVAEALISFDGMKILIIQDEYDHVEMTRKWMDKISFDHVFTCVPADSVDAVYPRSRFPRTIFTQVLTGYVPENPIFQTEPVPMEQRTLRIVYRGRALPYRYGNLAREKYNIGFDVKELAQERGIAVDIEVDDSRRIYGADWPRFLASGRATLGTESGSNVFDFDGSLDLLSRQYEKLSYEDFHARFLAEREGKIRMNQISPKFFEAIHLRTALILFEGEYSGILEPHVHYIPLNKDYSNIEQVFERLEDVEYLNALTDRAYRDVIQSGKYSFRKFVSDIDELISDFCRRGARAEIIYGPIGARLSKSDEVALFAFDDRSRVGIYRGPLMSPGRYMAASLNAEEDVTAATPSRHILLRRIWRAWMPVRMRSWLYELRVRSHIELRVFRNRFRSGK